MAFPLLQDTGDAAAGVIVRLEKARGRPDDAVLRQAVACAAEIAPAVIALVEKAADDVYLTPSQSNLLFWGVHALAAGRRTELCQPLLRLLRRADDDQLEDIFGDGITETVKQVVISVFDGGADALIAAIADPSVNGFIRWGLLDGFARLTFDGAISQEQALDFLDRFERERLAEPFDPAWEGWVEAVVYLGLEPLHDRLRRACHDGVIDETISGPDWWEREIAIVRAMRPGDPALFDRERFAPITDIGSLFRWMTSDADLAKEEAVASKDDPAAGILAPHERAWLESFLASKHAPDTAMTIEAVDGYFTALAVCPNETERSEYWPALWNYDAETDAEPFYDSDEQEEYVDDLLGRYLEAIKRRIASGFRHPSHAFAGHEKEEARNWAAGVLRGVVLHAQVWGDRAEIDEDCGMFMSMIYALGTGYFASGESLTSRYRKAFFARLPSILLSLCWGWRGVAAVRSPVGETWSSTPEPLRQFGRKIGRNEPCPCGSGKKYKRCCGNTPAVN
jgi:yecA family protein